jgi:nitrite reductase (cytochrome c-552)
MKVSEHWVRSPLLSVSRAYETCPPYGDDEIKSRVEAIQDRHFALLTRGGQAATSMIDAIVAVRRAFEEQNRETAEEKVRDAMKGKPDFQLLSPPQREEKVKAETKTILLGMWQEAVSKAPKLKELGELQRAAQWRLDFVAAESTMGFHAPQEMASILAESIAMSRQAEVIAITIMGGKAPIAAPSASVVAAASASGLVSAGASAPAPPRASHH